MLFYDLYKKTPFEDSNKLDLDKYISIKDKEFIYKDFEKATNDYSKVIYKKLLPNFCINTENSYLLDPFKQFVNIFYKIIIMQDIYNNNKNDEIIIDCYTEELKYFDNEYHINRFANIYALIANELPSKFNISDLGNCNLIPETINDTRIDNLFLRIGNLDLKIIFSKLFDRINLFKRKKKKNIFMLKETEIIKEVIPYLKKEFNLIDLSKKLTNCYNKIEIKHFNKKFFEEEFDNCFSETYVKYNVEEEFQGAYKNIIVKMVSYKIEKLIKSEQVLYNKVENLKKEYNTKLLLTNGLFGIFGLAVNNAMQKNNIKVICSEHGLTTGLCKCRKSCIDYYEPRTSNIILTYNKAASKTYKSSANKELICYESGAPKETKRIKNYLLQRFISRNRLKVKGITIFYASLNLSANNNTFFPYYSPDYKRFEIEKSLFKKVFSKIKRDVIYKYYPTQNYIYKNNPYVKLSKISKNIKVAQEEDFRYIRTAADIIVTSNPSSTLGWVIGLDKPLVYLDSLIYNSLENDDVRQAFNESFFVINYDNDEWEKELLNFLNKPYSEIMKLWKEKKIFRDRYDDMYFLSNNKNTGKITSKFIKGVYDE